MANNASATVDLRILISVIQNQSQNLRAFQQQVQNVMQQLQSSLPQGAIAGLSGQMAVLNTQVNALQGTTAKGVTGVKALESAVGSLTRGIKFLAGGFLALQAVQFVKGLADTAARAEVLTTVLHVVALNAGYTAKQIDDVRAQVQRLGISSDAAAQSLTQMMQANIDIKFAAGLARAAQDLAVIEGSDSSATFERLISAIQRLNTLSLRRMGIVVSMTQAEARWRAANKEHRGELDAQQRSEALLMEVMEKAKGLQGTYEAAMGNVGKQLSSLKRLFGDLREELGKQLLPAYSALISELSLFLTQMAHILRIGNANMDWAERFGEVVRRMARKFFEAVRFLYEHRLAIEALIAVYLAYWTVVTTKAAWAHGIVVVQTLTTAIWETVVAIRTATAATLAWAAANGLVARTGAAATAVNMWPPGWTGRASSTANIVVNRAEDEVGDRVRRQGLPSLIALMVRYRTVIMAAASAVVAFVAAMNPLVLIIGAATIAFAGFFTVLYKFTSAGPEMLKTWVSFKDLLSEISRLVTNLGGALFKGFFVAIETGAAAVGVLAEKLEFLIEQIEKIPGNPITAAKEKIAQAQKEFEMTTEFFNSVGKKMKEWSEYLELTFNLRVTNKGAMEALEKIRAALPEVEVKVKDAENEWVRLTTKEGISPLAPSVQPAKKRLDDAKAEREALLKEETRIFESLNTRDQAYAKEKAAYNKKKAEDARIMNAAAEADKNLNKVFFGGQLVSKEFADANSNVQKLIDRYLILKQTAEDMAAGKKFGPPGYEVAATGEETAETKKQVEELRQGVITMIEQASPAVTDTAARALLQEQVARVFKFASAAQQDLLRKLAVAQGIQISKYVAPAVQPTESLRVARFRDQQAEIAAGLEHRLELTRIANEKEDRLDKELLIKKELTQDYYNLRVLGRKQALIDRELAVEQGRIDSLKAQQIEGVDKGPEAQIATARALATAEQKLQELKAKKIEELLDLNAQQREAVRQVTRDTTLEVAQQIAAYGTLAQVLEAIDLKHQKAKEQLVGEDTRVIDAQRDKEILEAKLGQLDKDLTLAREIARARNVLIDAEKQQLDLARERIDLERAAGRLTTREAMLLSNAQLRLEILNAQKKLEEDRILLSSTQLQILEKTALVEEDMFKKGFERDSKETQLEVLKVLGELPKELDAIILRMQAAGIAIDRMADKTQNYSKTLKEHFVKGFADALTTVVTDFKSAGDAMVNFSKSISNEIVNIFMTAFTERLFKRLGLFKWVDALMDRIFGKGPGTVMQHLGAVGILTKAEGGLIRGPGTGTSDSIPAMLSAGEHVMPADKAAQWLPVLEAIRTGRLGMAMGGLVQSISIGSVIPRRYAGGGIVQTDGGAAAVMPGGGMGGNMMVQLHPEALNMTMRDWLEHEVVRQHSRR